MAKIIRCDGGCGKESPNESGHIANHWTDVKITAQPQSRNTRELQLCGDCMGRVERALREVPPGIAPHE